MRPTCEEDIREALKAEGFELREERQLRIVDEWKYCALCNRLRRPILKVPCGRESWAYTCPDRLACAAAARGGDSERLRDLLGEVTIPQKPSTGPNEETHE